MKPASAGSMLLLDGIANVPGLTPRTRGKRLPSSSNALDVSFFVAGIAMTRMGRDMAVMRYKPETPLSGLPRRQLRRLSNFSEADFWGVIVSRCAERVLEN